MELEQTAGHFYPKPKTWLGKETDKEAPIPGSCQEALTLPQRLPRPVAEQLKGQRHFPPALMSYPPDSSPLLLLGLEATIEMPTSQPIIQP